MTVDDFFNKLVKVIYILSLISLPLYVLQLLIPNILFDINNILYKISPSFFSIGGDSYSNSIVFTIYKRHILRNCGFSWEPGAFGFLLTLSLLIYLTIKKDKKIDKTIVVLVIAIITTLSTTAYIGLMISMIYYYFNLNNTKKNIIYFIVYVPAFIIIINQPFVYDKIENTYDIETNDLQVTRMRNFSSSQGEMYTPSRFASLIIDYRDFVKDPILGRGLNKETRFSSESENVNFANGLSNLLVKFGIIGFLLYFYFLSKSIKKLSIEYDKKYYFIILMGIIAIGFSEPLLESPLLFSIQYYFFKKR
ncbi:MAG: hypothetical protein K9H06_12735 [Melioribacteraceae bacterium]|nr:hypothetical protein [Melioribacteraceae bacterium]